ncbi:hypothetical protein AHiyo1_50890 [Arthrobacter sp. Hiyo1]|nr:hypothetical protein AHiyo1_50890 [Arthrobacter sp. Hiyo1]
MHNTYLAEANRTSNRSGPGTSCRELGRGHRQSHHGAGIRNARTGLGSREGNRSADRGSQLPLIRQVPLVDDLSRGTSVDTGPIARQ